MVNVRISQWESRHESLGVERRLPHAGGFSYPETWVRVPREMPPDEAIVLAGTLGLTDEEFEAFVAEMDKRRYCGCGGAPAVIMGYSSGYTGQVPFEPYCGDCLDKFFEDMGHVLRSAAVYAYPGVDNPQYPDGRPIPGVHRVAEIDRDDGP